VSEPLSNETCFNVFEDGGSISPDSDFTAIIICIYSAQIQHRFSNARYKYKFKKIDKKWIKNKIKYRLKIKNYKYIYICTLIKSLFKKICLQSSLKMIDESDPP